MVRTATEVLLIGPLQGGLGQPCDAPESPSETYETGAVAILHGDFIQQALRETGEPADVMPSACLEGRDLPRVCTSDRTWVYDYCWSGKKATLAQQVNGAWQQVAKLTGKKYAKCGKKYPYRILFTRTDAPGTYAYKVTVGKTADEFTATVS